jgi:PAS domain-containing protein
MSVSIDHSDDGSFVFDALATAVLDEHCTVLGWSRSAADLVGRTAGEVCERPVRELLADVPPGATSGAGFPAAGGVRLRHRSGGMIDVTCRVIRMEGVCDLLVLALPTHHVTERNHGVSLMRALCSQDLIGIGIHDRGVPVR